MYREKIDAKDTSTDACIVKEPPSRLVWRRIHTQSKPEKCIWCWVALHQVPSLQTWGHHGRCPRVAAFGPSRKMSTTLVDPLPDTCRSWTVPFFYPHTVSVYRSTRRFFAGVCKMLAVGSVEHESWDLTRQAAPASKNLVTRNGYGRPVRKISRRPDYQRSMLPLELWHVREQ